MVNEDRNPGISVIICCYNSADRLPKTIRHIANQKVGANFNWEVIVVDNASKDNTKAVALQEWRQYNLTVPFYIIEELKPGLAFAREAGINQAKHDLITFCDDDNWLDEHYLLYAFELMEQNPAIGCLGGYNEAVADVPFPVWFKAVEQAYACGPQNDQEGWLTDRLYIVGAGMVVRRRIFNFMRKIGFATLLSDRTGNNLSSGGDNEVCMVALMMGYKLYYSSKLKLKHYMNTGRLTWDYYIRMTKGHARSWYLLDLYSDIYKNKPIKKNWLHESAIRLVYFLKEHPVKTLIKWGTIGKKEGDVKSIGEFMITEKLLAHLLNFKFRENIKEIESLYTRINNQSGRIK